MNPLVSIIIPTYNRAHLIGETLQSVLDQTYQNWECIVVDDLSTDNTDEVLKSWTEKDNRFKYFKRHREPKGAPTCRNIGLDKAEGEYVIFLDSDDLLLSSCLKNRIKEIEQSPDLEFAVFQTQYFRDANPIQKFNIVKERKDYLTAFLSHDIPWQTTSVFWRHETLIQLGGFNELYPRLQDAELHTRALLMFENRFRVFNSLPADSYYIKRRGREELVPALKGFFIYLRKIYPIAKKKMDESVLRGALNLHIRAAEKFFVRYYERRKTLRIFWIVSRLELLSMYWRIRSPKQVSRYFIIYFNFIIFSFINFEKSRKSYIEKLSINKGIFKHRILEQ